MMIRPKQNGSLKWATAIALAGLVCGSPAQAQDAAASYPNKTVRIISG